MEERKIIEYKDNKYHLNIGFDDESMLIKVTMTNIDTKEEIDINISGLIPQGATPDCVMLHTNTDTGIFDKLEELNLLEVHGGLFAKVNLQKAYEYDKKGVKAFLDYHTHKVEYEDKGKTVDEVKREIRKYTEEILASDETKDYLDLRNMEIDTENYIFMCSMVDKKSPQDSIILYCNENADRILMIQPYLKLMEDKIRIIPDWQYNFEKEMMTYLSHDFDLIEVGESSHYSIWENMYYEYCNNNKEYDKGVQKYLKYCKKNKINKEYIMKMYGLKNFPCDMMKFYKNKEKCL